MPLEFTMIYPHQLLDYVIHLRSCVENSQARMLNIIHADIGEHSPDI